MGAGGKKTRNFGRSGGGRSGERAVIWTTHHTHHTQHTQHTHQHSTHTPTHTHTPAPSGLTRWGPNSVGPNSVMAFFFISSAGPPVRRTPLFPSGGPPNISRFFFLSSAPIFALILSRSLWGSFGGVFDGQDPQMCTFGLSGCRVKPRRPQSGVGGSMHSCHGWPMPGRVPASYGSWSGTGTD